MGKVVFNQLQGRRLANLLLILVSASGAILILDTSRFGLGTTGDSVHYLMGAENIIGGEGFGRSAADGTVRPITMFAPLFSTAISGWGLIGSIFDGARYLQAFLFAASIYLLGRLVLHHTSSLWATLAGAFILLASKNVILYHTWLMPEALYISLMLLSIYMLTLYLENRRTRLLILTSLAAGLATLTRYVGISLIALVFVYIFLKDEIGLKKRLREIALLALFGLGPIVLWLGRNFVVAGDAVNRAIRFHPVPAELVRAYRAEISYWFVPEQLGLPHSIRRFLMILIGILAPVTYYLLELREALAKKSLNRANFLALPWILLIYTGLYLGTFFINLTFLDAFIDFDTVGRYLTPIYVIGVIIFVIVYHELGIRMRRWWFPWAIIAGIGISLITLYAHNSLSLINDPGPYLGYTGIKMEQQETVQRLESISRSAAIITNDPEMVYMLANRTAYMLPIRYDANIGAEREDFDQQIEATRRKLDQGGMLVIFSPISDSAFEVIDLLEVELIDSFYGSLFYGYPWVIDR